MAGAVAVAASTDPTQSNEYRAMQASVTSVVARAEATAENANAALRSADASLTLANQDLQQRQAAIASSEAAAASSAAAVAAAVQTLAQNSISEGTWTVGTDVQPGRYRTSAPVTEGCYWEITRSGTNGSSIIQNDLPTGGYPTVALSAGQDFSTRGCGTWLKQ